MPSRYSSDDLGRLLDADVVKRGRTLVLIGAAEVALSGDTLTGVVDDRGTKRTVTRPIGDSTSSASPSRVTSLRASPAAQRGRWSGSDATPYTSCTVR